MKKALFSMLMIAGLLSIPALAQYDGPYQTCRGHESWWNQVVEGVLFGTASEWEWDTRLTNSRCCQGAALGSVGVHITAFSVPDNDLRIVDYDYETVPVSECQQHACANLPLSEGY